MNDMERMPVPPSSAPFPGCLRPPMRPEADFTLFVGPVTCFYHCCGPSAASSTTAALCPTDVGMALGRVEELTLDAVDELLAGRGGEGVRTLLIVSACTSTFAGIDFAHVVHEVERRHGIICLHFEHNRILLPKPTGFPDPQCSPFQGELSGKCRTEGVVRDPSTSALRAFAQDDEGVGELSRECARRPSDFFRSGDEHFPTSGPGMRRIREGSAR